MSTPCNKPGFCDLSCLKKPGYKPWIKWKFREEDPVIQDDITEDNENTVTEDDKEEV